MPSEKCVDLLRHNAAKAVYRRNLLLVRRNQSIHISERARKQLCRLRADVRNAERKQQL